MHAGVIWITLVVDVIALIVLVVVIDLHLAAHGAVTVTQFLRAYPWWFWGPWIMVNVFAVALAIHLFSGA